MNNTDCKDDSIETLKKLLKMMEDAEYNENKIEGVKLCIKALTTNKEYIDIFKKGGVQAE